MADRKPKMKALGSFALALLLLGGVLFFWWQLVYVYNVPEGGAWLVWKRAEFGDLAVDATSPAGRLQFNMGNIPSSRRFMKAPFNDKDGFWIVYLGLWAWGLVQLYMGLYYVRQRAP